MKYLEINTKCVIRSAEIFGLLFHFVRQPSIKLSHSNFGCNHNILYEIKFLNEYVASIIITNSILLRKLKKILTSFYSCRFHPWTPCVSNSRTKIRLMAPLFESSGVNPPVSDLKALFLRFRLLLLFLRFLSLFLRFLLSLTAKKDQVSFAIFSD